MADHAPKLLDEICFYLGRAYYNYVALLDRNMRKMKLHQYLQAGMGHVMAALYERDDRIIKEIVESTLLSPSTLTGILDKMKKAKLIARRRDKVDGRAVRIRLTPFGRSLQSSFVRLVERLHEVLCAGFDAKTIEDLKNALTGMIANMRRDEEGELTPRRGRVKKMVKSKV